MNKYSKVTAGVCSIAAIMALLAERIATDTLKYKTLYSPEAYMMTAEGEGCRTIPYKDVGGLYTNGIGHLCTVKGEIRNWTLNEVVDHFNADIYKAEQCVLKNFDGVNLPKRVRESLTDFVFNVGCRNATVNKNGNMTNIRKLALSGKYKDVCNEFGKWKYARVGGKMMVVKGLENRRRHETKWCLKND